MFGSSRAPPQDLLTRHRHPLRTPDSNVGRKWKRDAEEEEGRRSKWSSGGGVQQDGGKLLCLATNGNLREG